MDAPLFFHVRVTNVELINEKYTFYYSWNVRELLKNDITS